MLTLQWSIRQTSQNVLQKVIWKHHLSYPLKYVSNGIPLFHCQLSGVIRNKEWRKYVVNNNVSVENTINSINSSTNNSKCNLPAWLPVCGKNASLSPCLPRCSLQHDEPSTSIHCTIMSMMTLLQRKCIRWGCGRTVNSTITVTVCTRC